MYPSKITNLINSFKLLPGIGEKTAERLVFSLLDMEQENIEFFSENLKELKNSIKKCKICNGITENDVCDICKDTSRSNVLCVLDDVKNVFLFEKMGVFSGHYHVLDGLISPIDGINPEDIGIDKLLERINKDNYSELMFAFKPSIEGETTALYIKRVLSDANIKVTRLASGLPMGADIEYVDNLTLQRAINDRKEVD